MTLYYDPEAPEKMYVEAISRCWARGAVRRHRRGIAGADVRTAVRGGTIR